MKKLLINLFFISLCFFFGKCKQSDKHKPLYDYEKHETVSEKRDGNTLAHLSHAEKNRSTISKNKQNFVKIERVKIPNKFIKQKMYGERGEIIYQKIPDTEIVIDIAGQQFHITKQDIPDMNTDFVKKSVFQKINYLYSTEKESIFEIIFGETDTDNIVFVHLTIDTMGNKSFKIKYPEWDE